ncbi:MAG: haloacid dehalogenase-like hydrolase [Erysipelotrichaceae bacterium]|nr:haloacid dehalogenase-like hydrolase [Erysipelotrichaceae bacterium]
MIMAYKERYLKLFLVIFVCLTFIIGLLSSQKGKPQKPIHESNPSDDSSVINEPLPKLTLWSSDSKLYKTLPEYLKNISDESGDQYIPVTDRIAVFDFDGTLFCETDPCYFNYQLLAYRILKDPSYKNHASNHERMIANRIQKAIDQHIKPRNVSSSIGKMTASAFKGMSLSDFKQYVIDFGSTKAPGYKGMLRKEAFYQPMLQVIDLLKAYDFTIYIITATDSFVVQALAHPVLNIPNNHILGSDQSVKTKNNKNGQGSYKVLGGQFLFKNAKKNKVKKIKKDIGIRPVLSFGNSDGDIEMANYTMGNPKYESQAYMLCCDDTKRENGDMTKAKKMKKMCQKYDWIPISMKKDWTTIYGQKVTKR